MADVRKFLKDKRISPRLNFNVNLKITAQLIGSANKFQFVTENISGTGLLVTQDPAVRHAFNQHSILEVWIETDQDDPIYFFAKYVRKASDSTFAIRIADIDSRNERLFTEFMDRIGRARAAAASE